MTDLLSIPAGSLRTAWVFRIDLPADEIAAFAERPGRANGHAAPWPLQEGLGVADLDPEQIEVFEAKKLADYGLARYLTEANGMDASSVAPDAAMLDGLTGHLLLVLSAALPDGEVRLNPRPPLHLVGRYAESLDFAVREAPESAAARGPITDPPRKRTSDAAMSGRVATVALLVMFALVGLMVWVAG